MRGRSIDSEFVFSFIQECASKGKTTPQEVCEEVLLKMEEIDKQLKHRIKLSVVLSFFNYKKKTFSQEKTVEVPTEVEATNQIITKEIIDYMRLCSTQSSQGISVNGMINYLSKDEDHKKAIIFTFKQLLKNRMIALNDDGDCSFGSNYFHK